MEPQALETLILIVHVLASLAIIGLVLIQHGKGADMGSGFGGGASGTVFGSGGAGNFLSKSTTYLAIGFFLTSFGLAYYAKEKSVAMRDLGMPAIVEQLSVGDTPVVGAELNSELPLLDADGSPADGIPQEESIPQESNLPQG